MCCLVTGFFGPRLVFWSTHRARSCHSVFQLPLTYPGL